LGKLSRKNETVIEGESGEYDGREINVSRIKIIIGDKSS